jgi:hypothetical protein
METARIGARSDISLGVDPKEDPTGQTKYLFGRLAARGGGVNRTAFLRAL